MEHPCSKKKLFWGAIFLFLRCCIAVVTEAQTLQAPTKATDPQGLLQGLLGICKVLSWWMKSPEGFDGETLILITSDQYGDQYKAIRRLVPGDFVLAIDSQGNLLKSRILEIITHIRCNNVCNIKIYDANRTSSTTIRIARSQCILSSNENPTDPSDSWIEAKDIHETKAQSAENKAITLQLDTEIDPTPQILYALNLKDGYNIIITTQKLVARNATPNPPSITQLFSEGLLKLIFGNGAEGSRQEVQPPSTYLRF